MNFLNYLKYGLILFLIIEIASFIVVADWIGIWATLGLVVMTTVLGGYILRRQGLLTRGEMMQSQPWAVFQSIPHPQLLLLVAGFLLVIPGFVTDIVGLILLLPPVRHGIEHWARKKGLISSFAPGGEPHVTPAGRVIEGEFERKDP